MASHSHNNFSGSQNVGNSIGTKSSVRQSKLYRIHESGNTMKAKIYLIKYSIKDWLLGNDDLNWDTTKQQGAYSGKVYDHNDVNSSDLKWGCLPGAMNQEQTQNRNILTEKPQFNVQKQIYQPTQSFNQFSNKGYKVDDYSVDSHQRVLSTRPWDVSPQKNYRKSDIDLLSSRIQQSQINVQNLNKSSVNNISPVNRLGVDQSQNLPDQPQFDRSPMQNGYLPEPQNNFNPDLMSSPGFQNNKRIQYPECKGKGLHEGEQMNLVCLDIGCQKNLIGCQECVSLYHRTHHFQSIKTLLNSIESDIIHQAGFDDRERLIATIDLSEQELIVQIEQLQNQLIEKTNQFKRSSLDVYRKMRDEVNKYTQNKHTVEDLFNKIYNTNHNQQTLSEQLKEILDLQQFQIEKEDCDLTPSTKPAYDKISKFRQQIDENLKQFSDSYTTKINTSVNQLKQFGSDKGCSLVYKDHFFVFENGDSATFTGESTVLEEHRSQVRCVAFSKNGKYLASGSSDNTLIIWDVQTEKALALLEGHKSYVMSCSFSPDGKYLVSGSYDKSIKIWNIFSQECVATLEGHSYLVNCVQFSHKGDRIVSGSNDSTIKVWKVENLSVEAILQGHQKWVFSTAFSPDDRQIASASGDRTIKIWNAQTYHCDASADLELVDGSDVIAFSPNGSKLVSGGPNGILKVWNTLNLSCEANIDVGPENRIWSVCFSKQGNRIAAASSDVTVRVWNIDSLKCECVLVGHTESVMCVQFSPDGRKLVSGSQDNTLRLWHTD